MKKILLTMSWLFSSLILIAQNTAQPDAKMLRFPDVSDSEIVFTYAEDLWVVSKEGGLARRITTATGAESFPKFSPDGKSIAFSGNYQGNKDIYTLSNQGSNLTRLTYHPDGENVVDWHPDGTQVLFASRRYSPSRRFNQLFTVDAQGGMAQQLPLFYAELGSYNPSGTKLAYQYLNRLFRTWKRYQGGTASDLWIYDFETEESVKITDYKGTDASPMWQGDDIYFLSDRGPKFKLNLWVYHTLNSSFEQVTFFEEYDVKFPSMGPEDIVFENGGSLYLYNYVTKNAEQVNIEVPAEHIQRLSQLKDLKSNINSFWISPTGKRALFDARGELITVPAEHGSTINLTNSSGSAEHHPHWSPDGKSIAYFSDQNGEYNLYIRNADGTGKPRQITRFTSDYFSGTEWSPDSKKIAFHDQKGNLFVLFVTGEEVIKVVRNDVFEITDYNWSPDSDWLVFSQASQAALFNTELWAYRLSSKKSVQLTNGFYSASAPVFSADGLYLFFASNRSFNPMYSDLDVTWIYTGTTQLVAVPLQASTPSILAYRNDMESVKKEENPDSKDGKKKDKKENKETEESDELKVSIDVENFEARAAVLPIPAGNYDNLYTAEGKLIFESQSVSPMSMPGASDIMYYDIEERKTETIISGVFGFEISADGGSLLYGTANDQYGIVKVSKGNKVGDGSLNLSDMTAFINPEEEWTQIYNEAWRLERDFFYDPNMHGVNWTAVGQRYRELLPYCSSRNDLNYIIGEMIGELNVGHAYVGGGDRPQTENIGVGLLGVDFEKIDGYYRIKKIYRSADYDVEARSPLSEPALDVKEGDYVLAVNRLPVDADLDPYAAFVNTTGKLVTLTVSSTPDWEGAHTIDVKPIGSELNLRNRAWIEDNRQKVLAATDGKCGYIYVPNTGVDGQNELVRQYQGQVNKEALIIDERFNSGGQIPDRFIEMLNRPNLNYWGRREFKSWPTPFVSNQGPKVMLANEWAGSGGDAFPYYFKKAGIGPVVGKRTWGGLVGISGLPPLVDGGFLSSPNFGMYNNEGEWDVEGYGVDPDYEVNNTSDEVYRGVDMQLQKAIELVNEAMMKQPPKTKKPDYPIKTGIGNN